MGWITEKSKKKKSIETWASARANILRMWNVPYDVNVAFCGSARALAMCSTVNQTIDSSNKIETKKCHTYKYWKLKQPMKPPAVNACHDGFAWIYLTSFSTWIEGDVRRHKRNTAYIIIIFWPDSVNGLCFSLRPGDKKWRCIYTVE